jgi:predicted ester cyclase
LNLFQLAKEFGDARTKSDAPRVLPSEPARLAGQGKPLHLPAPGNEFDLEDELRRAHHYSWNWRNMAALDRLYAPGLVFHGPTDRELRGLGAYKSFILSMIAMFPDIASQIDELYWMGNEVDGFMTSIRWSAVGTHRGFGVYGPPSGRQVRLWGIVQQHIRGTQVIEEWMMFNEFDVLQQILASDPI